MIKSNKFYRMRISKFIGKTLYKVKGTNVKEIVPTRILKSFLFYMDGNKEKKCLRENVYHSYDDAQKVIFKRYIKILNDYNLDLNEIIYNYDFITKNFPEELL